MRRSAIRELLKLTAQPEMISFAGGLPAADFFPIERVRAATETVLQAHAPQCLQYSATEGITPLREWIACQVTRPGLRITSANVAIVSGAQQALDLIGRVFLNGKDAVLVENPTYLALLSAWRVFEPEFVAVPSDENGISVADIGRYLERKPKLIYTTPNFQNPQGTTLSLERRQQLVRWLREHDLALVEDDPYGELRYEGDPLPSLFELDAALPDDGSLQSHVIHVGSFSKVLSPGLRVGWIVAAEEVIEKIVQAKQAADLQTSTLSQYITYELVRDGFLEQHVPRLREAYRERRDAMLGALERWFPTEATWTTPNGGMFLMVWLPEELDAAELLREAIIRQVAFVPGEEFHFNGAGRNTLRLNFSNAPPDRIEQGIRRLGDLLKSGFPWKAHLKSTTEIQRHGESRN